MHCDRIYIINVLFTLSPRKCSDNTVSKLDMEPLSSDQKLLAFISGPAGTPVPRCSSETPPHCQANTKQYSTPVSTGIYSLGIPSSLCNKAAQLSRCPGQCLNPGPAAPWRAPHPTEQPCLCRPGGSLILVGDDCKLGRCLKASFCLGMTSHRFSVTAQAGRTWPC